MSRIARARIEDLFGLASAGAHTSDPALADRYVQLARRVGTRYNVRLGTEHRELYCRGCSAFWAEGRTVRTRLRRGFRVLTCLRCGRVRRVSLRSRRGPPVAPETSPPRSADLAETAPVGEEPGEPASWDDEQAEEL